MRKELLIYGLSIGLILILIQVLELNAMLKNISSQTFTFLIALLFTVFGVLMAIWFFRKRGDASRKLKVDKRLLDGLSEREWDVLEQLCLGLTNAQMAEKLHVSQNTIKTHLSNLYVKMDVKRRTQAVQKANQLGLFKEL